ncbi:MAG TPA: hypothetical protein VGV40_11195, partial [Solirubrobacteraceae bacterium]|nr:hypothetical protein [Solirubrobacteraceae bacterium]
MELDQLVATVRGQSDLASEEEARESLLAVLEVVGAHVGRGGAEELAAGLAQGAACARAPAPRHSRAAARPRRR